VDADRCLFRYLGSICMLVMVLRRVGVINTRSTILTSSHPHLDDFLSIDRRNDNCGPYTSTSFRFSSDCEPIHHLASLTSPPSPPHRQSGKPQFSYIYGVALLGTTAIYLLLNLMSDRGIDAYRTASVLGYCLLPMVGLGGVGMGVGIE
jgi:hypothetical protein